MTFFKNSNSIVVCGSFEFPFPHEINHYAILLRKNGNDIVLADVSL